MGSVWPVSKLSTESVGSRCELVANCVQTADADASKHFRRVGVGSVYWALLELLLLSVKLKICHRSLTFVVILDYLPIVYL